MRGGNVSRSLFVARARRGVFGIVRTDIRFDDAMWSCYAPPRYRSLGRARAMPDHPSSSYYEASTGPARPLHPYAATSVVILFFAPTDLARDFQARTGDGPARYGATAASNFPLSLRISSASPSRSHPKLPPCLRSTHTG